MMEDTQDNAHTGRYSDNICRLCHQSTNTGLTPNYTLGNIEDCEKGKRKSFGLNADKM